ncbi:MAG: hypothetical protein QOJ72_159 [Nocardioidaceae bacterium]|jgi:very-short-patch-repair endonuclease|nr:hypothetical protein [Nocardioidaceae bacterium]
MAIAAGMSPAQLRGARVQRIFRGVYAAAGLELTTKVYLDAALLVMPADAVVSHTSAMTLYGLDAPRRFPRLSFSTNTAAVSRHPTIELHRRRGRLTRYEQAGLPVTGPDRTFVDCACVLSFIELVQLGDWLLHTNATTPEVLSSYAQARHLDGVRRARRALRWVRSGAESPRETLVRLMLVLARMPEPECNLDIRTAAGRFIARGDLPYPAWKVLVEYDGQQHVTDPKQRQRDRERREDLEAEGWRVIIVTARDLREPRSIPWRVFKALRDRGYTGPPPRFNDTWSRWFGHGTPI